MNVAYTERKRRLISAIKRQWMLLSFFIAALSAAASLEYLPENLWSLLLKITGRGEKAEKTADKLNSLVDAPQIAQWIVAGGFVVAVCIVAWKYRVAASTFLYERVFDRFHDELFEQISSTPSRGVAAGTERLRWFPPASTAHDGQADTWTDMQAWAKAGIDLRSSECTRFSWALLIGPSGSGKSRTAEEFARTLGRRSVFELESRGRRFPAIRDRWTVSTVAVCRRALRRVGLSDPWDAGYPAHRRDGSATLLHSSKYFAFLQGWRPRAPTLIVLDEPRPEEAAKLIELLAGKTVPAAGETKRLYNFPVRLLIVCQTIPFDVKLRPDRLRDGQWDSALGSFGGGPWILEKSNRLSWEQWQVAKRDIFKPDDRRAWITHAEYERITEGGQPLLVETLLAWIQAQSPDHGAEVSQLTPDLLLAQRAARIAEALTTAQLANHKHWCILVAASILGGLDQLGSPDSTIDRSALQRVFPTINVETRIPPIEPLLVALAFADLVVGTVPESDLAFDASEQAQQQTAALISKIAWQADPLGLLDSLGRINNLERYAPYEPNKTRPKSRKIFLSALKDVADSTPSSNLVAVTRTGLKKYVQCALSFEIARRYIYLTDIGTASTVLVEDAIDALEDPRSSSRNVISIMSCILERVVSEDLSDEVVVHLLSTTIRLAEALAPRRNIYALRVELLELGWSMLGQEMARRLNNDGLAAYQDESKILTLLDSLVLSEATQSAVLRPFCLALSQGLPERFSDIRLLAESAAVSRAEDGEEVSHFEARINAELVVDLADRAHGGIALRIWHNVTTGFAYSADAISAQRCAERVEIQSQLLMKHFGQDIDTIPWLPRAIAETAFAYSVHSDSESAEGCAVKLREMLKDDSTETTPATSEIRRRCCSAWGFASYSFARRLDVGNAERCAGEIAKIIGGVYIGSTTSLRLALNECYAWMQCAFAYGLMSDGPSSERCARRVSIIANHFPHIEFFEKRLFAEHETEAWCHALTAKRSKGNIAELRQCAEIIDGIVLPLNSLALTDRRRLAERQSEAWSRVAFVYATLLAPEEIEQCANRVESIAAEFSQLPMKEQVRLTETSANAWRQAAYAYQDLALPLEAERCADRIRHLIAPFENTETHEWLTLLELLVDALSHSARAYASSGDAAKAQSIANEISAAVRQYEQCSGAERLAELSAAAWSFAFRAYEALEHHVDARHCAMEVRRIVLRWQDAAAPRKWVEALLAIVGPAPGAR